MYPTNFYNLWQTRLQIVGKYFKFRYDSRFIGNADKFPSSSAAFQFSRSLQSSYRSRPTAAMTNISSYLSVGGWLCTLPLSLSLRGGTIPQKQELWIPILLPVHEMRNCESENGSFKKNYDSYDSNSGSNTFKMSQATGSRFLGIGIVLPLLSLSLSPSLS